MPIGANWRSLAPNPSAIGTTTPPIGGVVVPWHYYLWRHFFWRQSRFWRRVLAVDFYDPKKFGAKSESGAKN